MSQAVHAFVKSDDLWAIGEDQHGVLVLSGKKGKRMDRRSIPFIHAPDGVDAVIREQVEARISEGFSPKGLVSYEKGSLDESAMERRTTILNWSLQSAIDEEQFKQFLARVRNAELQGLLPGHEFKVHDLGVTVTGDVVLGHGMPSDAPLINSNGRGGGRIDFPVVGATALTLMLLELSRSADLQFASNTGNALSLNEVIGTLKKVSELPWACSRPVAEKLGLVAPLLPIQNTGLWL